MSRHLWIPVTLLVLGAGAMGYWTVQHRNSEACATCEAVEIHEPLLPPPPPLPHAPEAATRPPSPTLGEDEAPDFRGVGIELLRSRRLATVPSREEAVSTSDLQTHITRHLAAYFPDNDGMREGRALVALGALPVSAEPIDTLAIRGAFWARHFGAWREPERNVMLLAQDDTSVPTSPHALGQAFALLLRERNTWLIREAAPGTTDAWLARLGLLAGDAALTVSQVHRANLGPSHANTAPTAGGDFLENLDEAVFAAGETFATALHHLGDFDQVNAAYERPPIATAELLDPALYFAEEQFEPRRPLWKGLQVLGQSPFWDDTLGALATRVLLTLHLPSKEAEEAVPGWEGDRWVAYEGAAGARGQVAWQSFWKDKQSADHFSTALQAFLRASHPGAAAPTESAGLWRWTADGRSILLLRTHEGRGVFYVDASTPEFAAALQQKLVLP